MALPEAASRAEAIACVMEALKQLFNTRCYEVKAIISPNRLSVKDLHGREEFSESSIQTTTDVKIRIL